MRFCKFPTWEHGIHFHVDLHVYSVVVMIFLHFSRHNRWQRHLFCAHFTDHFPFIFTAILGGGGWCKALISDSFYCPLQLHVPIKFHYLCGCWGLTTTEWRLKSYQSFKFMTYMTHIPHPTETPFYCVGWVRCIDIEKPQYLWLDESWTIIVQGNKYIVIHVYISTQ